MKVSTSLLRCLRPVRQRRLVLRDDLYVGWLKANATTAALPRSTLALLRQISTIAVRHADQPASAASPTATTNNAHHVETSAIPEATPDADAATTSNDQLQPTQSQQSQRARAATTADNASDASQLLATTNTTAKSTIPANSRLNVPGNSQASSITAANKRRKIMIAGLADEEVGVHLIGKPLADWTRSDIDALAVIGRSTDAYQQSKLAFYAAKLHTLLAEQARNPSAADAIARASAFATVARGYKSTNPDPKVARQVMMTLKRAVNRTHRSFLRDSELVDVEDQPATVASGNSTSTSATKAQPQLKANKSLADAETSTEPHMKVDYSLNDTERAFLDRLDDTLDDKLRSRLQNKLDRFRDIRGVPTKMQRSTFRANTKKMMANHIELFDELSSRLMRLTGHQPNASAEPDKQRRSRAKKSTAATSSDAVAAATDEKATVPSPESTSHRAVSRSTPVSRSEWLEEVFSLLPTLAARQLITDLEMYNQRVMAAYHAFGVARAQQKQARDTAAKVSKLGPDDVPRQRRRRGRPSNSSINVTPAADSQLSAEVSDALSSSADPVASLLAAQKEEREAQWSSLSSAEQKLIEALRPARSAIGATVSRVLETLKLHGVKEMTIRRLIKQFADLYRSGDEETLIGDSENSYAAKVLQTVRNNNRSVNVPRAGIVITSQDLHRAFSKNPESTTHPYVAAYRLPEDKPEHHMFHGDSAAAADSNVADVSAELPIAPVEHPLEYTNSPTHFGDRFQQLTTAGQKVLLTNVPSDITIGELIDAMRRCGYVTGVEIFRERVPAPTVNSQSNTSTANRSDEGDNRLDRYRSRAYAFVYFEDSWNATAGSYRRASAAVASATQYALQSLGIVLQRVPIHATKEQLNSELRRKQLDIRYYKLFTAEANSVDELHISDLAPDLQFNILRRNIRRIMQQARISNAALQRINNERRFASENSVVLKFDSHQSAHAGYAALQRAFAEDNVHGQAITRGQNINVGWYIRSVKPKYVMTLPEQAVQTKAVELELVEATEVTTQSTEEVVIEEREASSEEHQPMALTEVVPAAPEPSEAEPAVQADKLAASDADAEISETPVDTVSHEREHAGLKQLAFTAPTAVATSRYLLQRHQNNDHNDDERDGTQSTGRYQSAGH